VRLAWDTNSIALSSLIRAPYNYWGDDDGDGVNGITATGSLNLSIVDNFNNPVARNKVLDICKAPYKLTLSNGEGRLTTRYGAPNESRFNSGNATYYIKPKASPVICFARPNLQAGGIVYDGRFVVKDFRGPADIWNPDKGFLPQSSSYYGLNFPTTGANNLYFDLDIGGSNQALSWDPVSHGGITATMTDSTSTSVRVTLTGPAVTDPNKWRLINPGRIDRISLPQTFELVGRDSSGNAVVKYGFKLKRWFVNRGDYMDTLSGLSSWCNGLGGYRPPKVKDLTNASCRGDDERLGRCPSAVGATPSSSSYWYMRYIGAGFFTEWGPLRYYANANFFHYDIGYLVSDPSSDRNKQLIVDVDVVGGRVLTYYSNVVSHGVCIYPYY